MVHTATAFVRNGYRGRVRFVLITLFWVLPMLFSSCASLGIGTGGTGYQGGTRREKEIDSAGELSKEDRQRLSRAAELYRRVVEEEGSQDGIHLYRYARSLELLEGESPRTRQLYQRAKISLLQDYPDHYYLERLE
jgi:hypothetical protein